MAQKRKNQCFKCVTEDMRDSVVKGARVCQSIRLHPEIQIRARDERKATLGQPSSSRQRHPAFPVLAVPVKEKGLAISERKRLCADGFKWEEALEKAYPGTFGGGESALEPARKKDLHQHDAIKISYPVWKGKFRLFAKGQGGKQALFPAPQGYSPALLSIHAAWLGGPEPRPGAYPCRRQWFRNFWACTMASRMPRPNPR